MNHKYKLFSLLSVVILCGCAGHYQYKNAQKDDPVLQFAGGPTKAIFSNYTEENHLLWVNTSGDNKCSDYQFAGLVQKHVYWYTPTQVKPLQVIVPKSKKLYLKTGWDTNNIHEYCRSSAVYFTPQPNTHYAISMNIDSIHCMPIAHKILANGQLAKQSEILTKAPPCEK